MTDAYFFPKFLPLSTQRMQQLGSESLDKEFGTHLDPQASFLPFKKEIKEKNLL